MKYCSNMQLPSGFMRSRFTRDGSGGTEETIPFSTRYSPMYNIFAMFKSFTRNNQLYHYLSIFIHLFNNPFSNLLYTRTSVSAWRFKKKKKEKDKFSRLRHSEIAELNYLIYSEIFKFIKEKFLLVVKVIYFHICWNYKKKCYVTILLN